MASGNTELGGSRFAGTANGAAVGVGQAWAESLASASISKTDARAAGSQAAVGLRASRGRAVRASKELCHSGDLANVSEGAVSVQRNLQVDHRAVQHTSLKGEQSGAISLSLGGYADNVGQLEALSRVGRQLVADVGKQGRNLLRSLCGSERSHQHHHGKQNLQERHLGKQQKFQTNAN